MADSKDLNLIDILTGNNSVPAAASTTIYKGVMVGLSSGYGHGLTAGDTFVGHSTAKCDNSAGGAGALNIPVRGPEEYCLEVTLASVAVTDVGKTVYASDSETYTLTSGQNSVVGRVARYVAANTCVVIFRPCVVN